MAVTFGNYVIERWLAQGGMANIFYATYAGALGFTREVALKVILPEYAYHSSFINMFLDEAHLSARLTHPNIVQVQDLGQIGDHYYIAMEYVPGQSLSRVVTRARRERKPLAVGISLLVIGEVLEALYYAHQRLDRAGRPLGIVHRDINPQNILVSYYGHVKLTDFGVAKANINLHDSQAGVIKGKYSHMAPEQCLGKKVDERADIFAAGIVLHELLSGQPLFQRPTAYEMMKAVVEDEIPSPSQLNPASPIELDGVVMKALARRPEDRYPNALAFLDTLELVGRRLQLVEGKHDLRRYLTALYGQNRHNLAQIEEIGMEVTEDRISGILKGIKFSGRQRSNGDGGPVHSDSGSGVAVVPGRSNPSSPSAYSYVKRRSPVTSPSKDRTEGWDELDLDEDE